MAAIGRAIGAFVAKSGYSLFLSFAGHGVELSLCEEPTEIATQPDKCERCLVGDGLVSTVEPFRPLGTDWAENDLWPLSGNPKAPTDQHEHTAVATQSGPLTVIMPG